MRYHIYWNHRILLKDLDEEELSSYISTHLINQESFKDLTEWVIGKKDYPNHFGANLTKFNLKKKKASPKKKK